MLEIIFKIAGFSLLLCIQLKELFESNAFLHVTPDKRVKVSKTEKAFISLLIIIIPISTFCLVFPSSPPWFSASANSVLCFSPSCSPAWQWQSLHCLLHPLAVRLRSSSTSHQDHCLCPLPADWMLVSYIFISICMCIYLHRDVCKGMKTKKHEAEQTRHISKNLRNES